MASFAQLAEASKTELLAKIKNSNLRDRAMAIKEKAKAPLMQGGLGVAALAGGTFGGVVAGMKPTISRIPTDAIVGAVIALPCLAAAGNSGVDALAVGAWGMLAGAASRATQRATRDWREKRAADAGDANARQLQSLRQQITTLETPVTPAK